MQPLDSLLIPHLLDGYRSARYTVRGVMTQLLERADRAPPRNAWITRLSHDAVMHYVERLRDRSIDELPLYGIPFVIKDNIDLDGVPTTAACPGFAYTPAESAGVVRKLIAAGAIPLGKTNLDQFATGLVGVRSPYGPGMNSFDAAYVAGGSSCGSAIAVAQGLASFSLGTDTAGSGRVPAAFNNLVGLKPSIGRLSTHGVVPACRSLDCVSIFTLTAADAGRVLDAAAGYDAADPYSRELPDRPIESLRFGVPRADQLRFFGDADYERLYAESIRRLEALGGTRVDIDFEPFLAAGRLLYGGPWVAERYAAVGEYIDRHPDQVHPTTREIIAGGRQPAAHALFHAQYELKALARAAAATWSRVDLILTPTAGTIYRIDAVQADPIALNSTLGYYTTFMNLLDLAGVALPSGFRADGLPFGVTLVGPAATERGLLEVAGRLHESLGAPLGALGEALPAAPLQPPPRLAAGCLPIAVCGAHMSGLPLNHQLRARGAYLLQATRTAPHYRLIALPGGPPQRPGLIRVASGGAAIELEVWAMPAEHLGSFVAGIPAPLGIGKLELADGSQVPGFICEGYAAAGALDVTAAGGWRAHLAAAGGGV